MAIEAKKHDIYNMGVAEEYLDDDQITSAEEGFMQGYLRS